MEQVQKKAHAWETFDRLADELVRHAITFPQFVRMAGNDFARIARKVARRRRLPTWLDLDDLKNQAIELAWHYAFERPNKKTGAVGFDGSQYKSAGAYLRWKLNAKLGKIASRARGESQHTRKGPGTPEVLTRTGETPDGVVQAEAETALASARDNDALKRLIKAVRDVAVAQEVVHQSGGDKRLATFIREKAKERPDLGVAMRDLGIETEDDALRAVAALRGYGALPSRRKATKNGDNDRRGAPREGLGIAATN